MKPLFTASNIYLTLVDLTVRLLFQPCKCTRPAVANIDQGMEFNKT